MDSNFLDAKIKEKFGSVELFAQAMKVTAVTIYGWLKGANPKEDNLNLLVETLALNHTEMDKLFGVPPTLVFFRTKGLKDASEAIKRRSVELAETFFKIDGSSFVTDSLLTHVQSADVASVATYIRKLINNEMHEPVVLPRLLAELKRHNVSVSFLPFEKMGILTGPADDQVAFTARKGKRVNIFVDTRRTSDEVVFDICHELAHLVLDHEIPSEDDERMCNEIASELIYPSALIKLNDKYFEVFRDNENIEFGLVIDRFFELYSSFDWSARGLCIALRREGLIKKVGLSAKRLEAIYDQMRKSKSETMDRLYFKNLDSSSYDSLIEFFTNDIVKHKDVLRPIMELKMAASAGRLSPRRFAEIFAIDSGDADELVQMWREEHDHLASASSASLSKNG